MSSQTDLSALAAELTERIPRLMAEHSIPGVAIGLISGPSVWMAGFGQTRRGGGAPVGDQTAFSLQSISKTFTALTVLAAVRDGLLSLDDTVSKLLPEFTVQSRFEDRPQDRMTMAHLLSHTAGFTHEATIGSNYDVGGESFDEHVRSISATWLRYPVGARYEYSNLGIDLAAFIVARLRGQDFPACARDSVLSPAGMTRSTFDLGQIEAMTDRAAGHDDDEPDLPVKVPMVAAGGMYSCVLDLVGFVRAELAGLVLPPALTAAMRTIPFPAPGQTTNGYGLGLGLLGGQDWTVCGHSGGGFGFLTDLYFEPAAGTGVVLLTNCTSHPLQQRLALELLARLAGRDPEATAGRPAGPRRAATVAEHGWLRGEYAGRGFGLEISGRGDQLAVRAGQDTLVALELTGAGDLLVELPASGMPLSLRPVAGAGARPSYLISLQDGATLSDNSAPEPPAASAAARAAADAASFGGSYTLGRGPVRTPVSLELADGRLWLAAPEYSGLPRLRLDAHEHASGLYFASTGEALDLRADPPRYASIPMDRRALADSRET